MKRTVSIIFILSAFFFSNEGKAQDIHISQALFSNLNTNPAMAGIHSDIQAIAHYRNQWKAVATPYSTFGASYDMRFTGKGRSKEGILAGGINFFNDQSGSVNLSHTLAQLHLAYHLKLNDKSKIGTGLYGGYGQRSLKSADGKWGSQYNGMEYDPSLSSGEMMASQGINYFDLGAGVVYSFKKNERFMSGNDQRAVNIGLAAYHVNNPKFSFYDQDHGLYTRWSAFANGLFGIGGKNVSLLPAIYYHRQGPSQEILGGTYVRYALNEASKYTGLVEASAFSVGAFYRNSDAMIVKALFEWSNYSVGMGYDFNTSDLSEASGHRGGFEILLRFVTPSPFSSSASKSRI